MPKQLGKYEIIRTLGQGAMGEVYLAQHPALGREVAIKTILPAAAKGEDAEGRFRREAEAAGRLNHPNVVTVYDFDKDQDVLFLVMEYVKGEDLEDLIQRSELSQSQSLEVLAQVCDGLGHAHRNGVIHRDVKPSNVRVLHERNHLLAKVMDFGIARMEDSSLTATGIVMGTVSYMAPEYIRLGHATPQSDLFAVGVMLYECLTGAKPFPGDNSTTILFKIVSDPPPPLDPDFIRGISPRIRNVLDKALAKDPSERFQTADDFAKALRACKDPTWTGALGEATAMVARSGAEESIEATRPIQSLAPAPDPIPRPAPRRGKGGLYALACLGVLAVAGGVYIARRARPSATTPPPSPSSALLSPPAAAPASLPVSAPSPSPGAAPIPAPGRAAAKEPPKPENKPAATPAQPEPPKPEKPLSPERQGKQAAELIPTDPRQAASLLRPLVQAAPGSLELNAQFLAALYRANNPGDFERGLTRAAASGVTTKAMLTVPAFREAMRDEVKRRKASNGKGMGLLPDEVLDKVLAGLN